MQRRIRREAELPSFRLTLDELEVLTVKIKQLVDGAVRGASDIEIIVKLNDDELSFQGVAEMRDNEELPKQLGKFSIDVISGHVQVKVNSRYGEAAPAVFVTGETVGWCVATIEEVRAFVHRKRAWYWWLRGTPLGVMVFLPLFAPVVLEKVWGVQVKSDAAVVAGILVALALYSSRSKVFPTAVVNLHVERNVLRRYSAELALIISGLGLILSVVQAFVK